MRPIQYLLGGILVCLIGIAPVRAKDVRARQPALDALSSRSFVEIQDCLGDKYIATINFTVASSPISRGITYNVRSNQTGFVLILDLRDEGEKRTAKVYVKASPMSFVKTSEHLTKIQSCL